MDDVLKHWILRRLGQWATWLHALLGAFIGGAANAIVNIVVAPDTFNLHEGKEKLLTAALLSGAVSAALYLKTAPLPPLTDLPSAPTP
jgi:hypothetical protein